MLNKIRKTISGVYIPQRTTVAPDHTVHQAIGRVLSGGLDTAVVCKKSYLKVILPPFLVPIQRLANGPLHRVVGPLIQTVGLGMVG